MTPGTNRIALSIKLPEEFERMRRAYDPARMGPAVAKAVAKGLDKANVIVLSTISRDRFTGTGPFPPAQGKLGHRSRRLIRSLSASRARVVNSQRLDVRSGLGSNVKYFGIHEFGITDLVHVPAHNRTLASGRRVKVRQHARLMHMPARKPLRTGLGESKNQETYLAHLWDELEPCLLRNT